MTNQLGMEANLWNAKPDPNEKYARCWTTLAPRDPYMHGTKPSEMSRH